MEMATKSQIAKLHVLLSKLDLINDKKQIIMDLTKNRTDSSKALTLEEAKRLIGALCESDPVERLKSIINQLAYRAGITYGNTETDKILNKVKLDMFLKTKGAVKVELQKQTYSELIKTRRQFEAINQGITKVKDGRAADKLVNNLLNELNLTPIK